MYRHTSKGITYIVMYYCSRCSKCTYHYDIPTNIKLTNPKLCSQTSRLIGGIENIKAIFSNPAYNGWQGAQAAVAVSQETFIWVDLIRGVIQNLQQMINDAIQSRERIISDCQREKNALQQDIALLSTSLASMRAKNQMSNNNDVFVEDDLVRSKYHFIVLRINEHIEIIYDISTYIFLFNARSSSLFCM